MQKIKQYLEERIQQLRKADTEFCKDRWDMSKPDFERALAREMSNEVTARRHELQEVLKIISTHGLI